LDALSISHNCIKLIFLVLEEDSASLTHHLSADYAGNCFFASTSAVLCWLVVEDSSSSDAIQTQHGKHHLVQTPPAT
jgi:hypothetical protein